jgi:hypothetical protein
MKKLLFIAFLLSPSLVFADRLGSIRSGTEVMLSTQGIKNQDTLQSGATFYVSSGTVEGQFSVNSFPSSGVGSMRTTSKLNLAGNSFATGSSWLFDSGANTSEAFQITNRGASEAEFDYWKIGEGGTGIALEVGNEVGDLFSITGSAASFEVPLTVQSQSVCLEDGTDCPTGLTGYIQNRDTLQTGATFYVSSGTVAGPLTIDASGSLNSVFKVKLAGSERVFISTSTARVSSSDNFYIGLKPNSREYRIGTFEANGSMLFGRSDTTNMLIFTPSSTEVKISPVSGIITLGGVAISPGIVIVPYEGGGTGELDFGRRASDNSVAVGGHFKFWTNTGQTLPAWSVRAPGGATIISSMTATGGLFVTTVTAMNAGPVIGTFDANVAGSTLAFTDQDQWYNASFIVHATTNAYHTTTSTHPFYGRPQFSATASTATNCVFLEWASGSDFDTGVVPTGKFGDYQGGVDTSSRSYIVTISSTVSGNEVASLTFTNPITLSIANVATGGIGRIGLSGVTSLTGWNTYIAASTDYVIRICREGDSTVRDPSTITSYFDRYLFVYGRRQ